MHSMLPLNPYHSTLLFFSGSALLVMMFLVLIAVWRFPLWVQLITVLLGIAIVWGGLFIGSELGFRNWQAMPNAPDEAYADTAPLGMLIAGWLPAGYFTAAWWGVLSLIALAVRRIRQPKPPPRLPT